MTLEDVVNQLLLPILGDANPYALELSLEEEAVEAELNKRMSGNAKLSFWVSSTSKIFVATRCAAFITFWLCKFFSVSHSHYDVKPLYFRLAIKISAGASLPLAPMFLGHLYLQLDILRSDENQACSCYIVTFTILFCSTCCMSVLPGTWRSVGPSKKKLVFLRELTRI